MVASSVGPVRDLTIRSASEAHVRLVCDLFRRELQREPNTELVARRLLNYPSGIAEVGGEVIGYLYSEDMAPDILELKNLAVALEHRGNGVAARLLRHVEAAAAPKYRAVLLSNSTLYTSTRGKRDLTAFYTRNGYRVILQTEHTFVYGKNLVG